MTTPAIPQKTFDQTLFERPSEIVPLEPGNNDELNAFLKRRESRSSVKEWTEDPTKLESSPAVNGFLNAALDEKWNDIEVFPFKVEGSTQKGEAAVILEPQLRKDVDVTNTSKFPRTIVIFKGKSYLAQYTVEQAIGDSAEATIKRQEQLAAILISQIRAKITKQYQQVTGVVSFQEVDFDTVAKPFIISTMESTKDTSQRNLATEQYAAKVAAFDFNQ